MIGWIVALCVLLVLFALLMLRVGVQAEYGHQAFTVRVRIGPGYIQVFPKPKRAKKKAAAANAEKQKVEKPKEKGGNLKLLREFLPLILRTLKRLCSKIRVDKLDMVLTAGADDPGDAALLYGRANAALGALWQPIVNTCHVVDGHAKVDLDFEAKTTTVYLLCDLSLRVGQILALAVVFLIQAMKQRSERKD